MHAVIFGPRVGLDQEFLDSLAPAPADSFDGDDRPLIEAVDQLQDTATVSRPT